jgi:DNA-directed RNA polymerase subunit RPC12/RpoP
MSLEGWHELTCPNCSGKEFVATFRVIWQNGLGSSTRPHGYHCVACNQLVDQAKMIAFAKKADAERKIRDLESEIHG